MVMQADINEVLQQRADVNARLALIPYEGTPEVKERDSKRYLVAQGGGLLVVPEGLVPEFRALLVAHYEGAGTDELAAFMKEACWRQLGE